MEITVNRQNGRAVGLLYTGTVFTDCDRDCYWMKTDIHSQGFTTCIRMENGEKTVFPDGEEVFPVDAELVVRV